MPLLLASARRPSPWKNGGGSTTEIAVSPEGAGLDGFDWRISMARVEGDSPFSVFPGVDRVLTIVEGELILEVEGEAPARLDAASPPFAFPGDAPTFGKVVRGPVFDLNVMTRRGGLTAFVTRLALNTPREISPTGEALLIVLEGALDLETPDSGVRLGLHDAWRGAGGLWRLTPTPSACALVVSVVPVETGA